MPKIEIGIDEDTLERARRLMAQGKYDDLDEAVKAVWRGESQTEADWRGETQREAVCPDDGEDDASRRLPDPQLRAEFQRILDEDDSNSIEVDVFENNCEL